MVTTAWHNADLIIYMVAVSFITAAIVGIRESWRRQREARDIERAARRAMMRAAARQADIPERKSAA